MGLITMSEDYTRAADEGIGFYKGEVRVRTAVV